MKYLFERKFEKDFDKIKNPDLAKAILKVINNVAKASSFSEIPNIKKLKGHRTAYRIRIGDYRLGVFIENDTVVFAAFDHRKDIYSSFP